MQVLTRLCGDHLQANPPKKARSGQEEPDLPPSSPLSPEQLVRIQRNKAAALLRLAARNVPVGFGESWKKHLSGEFGKPYFIKVSLRPCVSLVSRLRPRGVGIVFWSLFPLLRCPFHA